MSRKLVMDNKAVAARVDMLGMMVADTCKYSPNDSVTWDLNQACIALQHAFDQLMGGEE
jgi:hypothetical protein